MKIHGRSSTPPMSPRRDSGGTDYVDENETHEDEDSLGTLRSTVLATRKMDPGHGKTPPKMKRRGRKMKGTRASFAMRSFGGQLGGGSTGTGSSHSTAPPVMNRKTHGAPGTGRV